MEDEISGEAQNLVPVGYAVDGVGPQVRAYLVICDIAAKPIGQDHNVATHARFVIEVKMRYASTQSINEDLSRLHALLQVAI